MKRRRRTKSRTRVDAGAGLLVLDLEADANARRAARFYAALAQRLPKNRGFVRTLDGTLGQIELGQAAEVARG